ncbi:MAG: ATP-dependent helicase HrpB [Chthoniobacteraceae bacterium]|nr:ATP-dependent helicase HrpB [Chthoniobacteraceae bacterium]
MNSRRELPIFELEAALTAALARDARLILQAPTGSGKSTQVPQMLLDNGLLGEGEVVVLQPRRLATRMLAARVAKERGCRLGGEVGFQIRFDKVTSAQTRIRFVTEGVLLRQMLNDPALRGVSAILFDEFHERHLYGDITLARALDLQATRRPDLKLVVMSATLDTAGLERYLAPCATLQSEGRTYPVEIRYLPRPVRADQTPVWDLAADALERLAPETEGDVLVFMPGAYEISRTIGAIRGSRVGGQFVALPLHGELPVADQDAAMEPCSKRKVIVSTNVAETSLTIEGVRVVIDSGLARIARFDPYRGINTLLVEKISRASADQRAGRAGRTAPGVALRLWSEREHLERAAHELPEVKRLDLAEVILTLKAGGVGDVAAFRWLEAPEPRALERAETLLRDLGALDGGAGLITETGRRMLAFPLHPRYARMLLAAEERGCVREAALVAALTQGRNLLRRGGNETDEARERALGEDHASDLFLMMRAWELADGNHGGNGGIARSIGVNGIAAREAGQLFEQFLKIAKAEGLSVSNRTAPEESTDEAVAKCILAGFPDQVAVRLDAGTLRCALVHGRRGVLARESVVRDAPLLVAGEVREISGKDGVQTLLSLATAIREEWLQELFPEAFADHTEVFYDKTLRRVMARRERRFHDLALASSSTDKVPPGEAAALLAREVLAGNCPLEQWDHAVEQWIVRLNRLREWMPELGLPALTEEDRAELIGQLCYGAATYKEIKERAVWPVVKAWLSGQQEGYLEKYAPERLEMPNGRRFKIAYDPSGPPTIAVRIQDLYGVEESLLIAAGRVPVTIQVLAPNHRPIQVTQNLRTFWREAYPKVKAELQRRYPRHVWK